MTPSFAVGNIINWDPSKFKIRTHPSRYYGYGPFPVVAVLPTTPNCQFPDTKCVSGVHSEDCIVPKFGSAGPTQEISIMLPDGKVPRDYNHDCPVSFSADWFIRVFLAHI
jgi:hypothetical protein